MNRKNKFNIVYFFLYLIIWADGGFARLIHHHQSVLDDGNERFGRQGSIRDLNKETIKHRTMTTSNKHNLLSVDDTDTERFAEQKFVVADDMMVVAMVLGIAIMVTNVINSMQNRWYAHKTAKEADETVSIVEDMMHDKCGEYAKMLDDSSKQLKRVLDFVDTKAFQEYIVKANGQSAEERQQILEDMGGLPGGMDASSLPTVFLNGDASLAVLNTVIGTCRGFENAKRAFEQSFNGDETSGISCVIKDNNGNTRSFLDLLDEWNREVTSRCNRISGDMEAAFSYPSTKGAEAFEKCMRSCSTTISQPSSVDLKVRFEQFKMAQKDEDDIRIRIADSKCLFCTLLYLFHSLSLSNPFLNLLPLTFKLNCLKVRGKEILKLLKDVSTLTVTRVMKTHVLKVHTVNSAIAETWLERNFPARRRVESIR